MGQTPLRVTTRLVEVNVLVRDKSGPVEGLSKGDFIVYDRGRRQNIAWFEVHSVRGPQPPAELPLASNEYTNRPGGARSAPQRAIVIVLDLINSGFSDIVWAKSEAHKALSQIQPQDQVGVYIAGSKLEILQDFTNDSRRLQDAIERYRVEMLARSPDVEGAAFAMEARLNMLRGRSSGEAQLVGRGFRGDRTLSVIDEIRKHLSAISGRKSVIWIGTDPPLDIFMLGSGSENGDVVVYPVDAEGLVGFTEMQAQNREHQRRPLASYLNHGKALREMARLTGGMGFSNTNGLRQAIDKAMADSEVTYTLGFYPDRIPDRGNGLRIDVRRKGVELGYRHYYTGSPRTAPPSPLQAIRDAMATPLDSTQLVFNVKVERTPAALNLAITLDNASVTLNADRDRRAGALDIGLDQRAGDGHVLNTALQQMNFEMGQAQFEEFTKTPHVVTIYLIPAPGLADLRIAVHDRNSGRLGTLTVPAAGK